MELLTLVNYQVFSLLIGDQEVVFWLWNKKSKSDQKAEKKKCKGKHIASDEI